MLAERGFADSTGLGELRLCGPADALACAIAQDQVNDAFFRQGECRVMPEIARSAEVPVFAPHVLRSSKPHANAVKQADALQPQMRADVQL